MKNSRTKGKSATGLTRNQLDSKSMFQLGLYLVANAAKLDGLPEEEIVRIVGLGTALTVTWANIATAQGASGAVFTPKPKRPERTQQPELPLRGVREADVILARGLLTLMETVGCPIPDDLRALAAGQ